MKQDQQLVGACVAGNIIENKVTAEQMHIPSVLKFAWWPLKLDLFIYLMYTKFDLDLSIAVQCSNISSSKMTFDQWPSKLKSC